MICADETPIRVGPGPKTRKNYLLVACTSLLTYYFLGDRSMASFKAFVFPDLTGVIVHDRYQNYDRQFPGVSHQLCCQHLLRDLEDAAQSYPDAIWPVQTAEALRALIHAANLAREQGLAAVPDADAAPHLRLFRHGVLAGLSAVRRFPGAKAQQPPARLLLECLRDREDDVLRFTSDPRIPPTSTRPNATCAPPRPSRRSPAGSAPNTPPAPVRHPRLRLHRRQARHQRLHRHPRRPHRKPLDATHPRRRLNPARKQSHGATQANATHSRPECITGLRPNPTRHAREGGRLRAACW